MPPPEGVSAKLRRSNQHLKAFGRSLRAYSRNTYGLAHEFHKSRSDPSKQKLVVSVVRIRKSPIMRWSMWLDEVAYHLRSALDATVYDLSISPHRPDPTGTAFPIARPTDANFDRKLIRYLSPDQQTLIERLQPYQAGNDDLLFFLNEVHRRNKHRGFQFSEQVVSLFEGHEHSLDVQDMDVLGIEFHHPHVASGLEKSTPLLTIHYQMTGPKPDMKMDAGIASKVFLWEREITTNDPAQPGVFRRLQARVEAIIQELYRLPRAP